MSEIATSGQLRMSFLRRALICVPGLVFLGYLSGFLAGSGEHNRWFAALAKPDAMPPGAAFGIVWAILYVLLGVALALVLNARGARGRGIAITLFAAQFALNLAWSPLFFAAHRVFPAFVLIVAMLIAAVATAVAFARVRRAAAWLLAPYLVWLCFAAFLNWQIHVLNPGAQYLAPGQPATHILL